MHSIKAIKRVQKAKKALEMIAYLSLAVDILISAATLISLRTESFQNVLGIIQLLSYSLTAIVIVSLMLMAEIILLAHYQNISETFLLLHGKLGKSIKKLYVSRDKKE